MIKEQELVQIFTDADEAEFRSGFEAQAEALEGRTPTLWQQFKAHVREENRRDLEQNGPLWKRLIITAVITISGLTGYIHFFEKPENHVQTPGEKQVTEVVTNLLQHK